MTIYFYSTREQPYGCFSNFSRYGFEVDAIYYKTSEHYFQAMKFIDSQGSLVIPTFNKVYKSLQSQKKFLHLHLANDFAPL